LKGKNGGRRKESKMERRRNEGRNEEILNR
jgi:hypothetical protein